MGAARWWLAALVLAAAHAAAAHAAAAPGQRLQKQGEQVYERCQACHSLEADRTGPRHCGLFGRRAGSVPGFAYSDAMKHADIVWTARTLDRFLANPAKMVPGTTMTYAGVTDAGERKALIAYLQQAARCKPQH